MTEPLLQVSDLRTHFPTPKGTVRAVDGVSFSVNAGETLGIVGESGSGKSILVRSIMRLLPPRAATSGEVLFDGRSLTTLSTTQAREVWGKDIAMVFQNPLTALSPTVRVGRQITEVLRRHQHMGRTEAAHGAAELLRKVGIPDPGHRVRAYPHELSGGMRQRVAIAIAISCWPRLLLADEPTTALDVTVQRQVLDLMESLRAERNMAMVLVSHDLGVVAGRAERIIVMYGGRAVESATVRELFAAPRHPYTVGLLGAIPRLEEPSHSRLKVIPGHPAQGASTGSCRFAPRCSRALVSCTTQDPPLVIEPSGRSYACFNPVDQPSPQPRLPIRAVG